MTRQSARHLERGWRSFERATIPNATAVQRECMRDAFYAGALVTFQTLTREVSGGDDITAEDMYLMLDLDAELGDFRREIDGRCAKAKEASS